MSAGLTGKAAIKRHTGEAQGPNIIRRPRVKELIDARLPHAAVKDVQSWWKPDRRNTFRGGNKHK